MRQTRGTRHAQKPELGLHPEPSLQARSAVTSLPDKSYLHGYTPSITRYGFTEADSYAVVLEIGPIVFGLPPRQPSTVIEGAIEAQLEEEFQLFRRMLGCDRPPKRRSTMLALRLGLTSQQVGQWMTRRARLENGEPTTQQKTPQQLARLEREMCHDPYPSTEHTRQIATEIGLSRKQVQAWFVYQRKTRGIYLDD